MLWNIEQIGDWYEFIKCLDDITRPVSQEQHHFLFRGQVNSSWKLHPSMARCLLGKGLSENRALILEKEAGREFSLQIHNHLDSALLKREDDFLELWSLMQHHRAPTRLLDWSSSPYVACYFAVESSLGTDAAIWCVDHQAINDRMQERFADYGGDLDQQKHRFFEPDGTPRLYFVRPVRLSSRMIAQQGSFSVSTRIFSDHADVLGDALKDHRHRGWKGWFHQIIIPASLKEEFLGRLRSMNITANSLFPGIDGLGQSINEYIKIAHTLWAEMEKSQEFPWYSPTAFEDW